MRTNINVRPANRRLPRHFDRLGSLAAWLAGLALLISLVGFAENWVWIFPRAAAVRLAGLDLPQSARLLSSYGTGTEKVYVWDVPGEELVSLKLPERVRSAIHVPQWRDEGVDRFGRFDPESMPSSDFEILRYDVPFWHVALYRDIGASRLVISAVAEKLDE